jgi:uncharacterized membrane protein
MCTLRTNWHPSLRILYMPPVYAVISFFSYRFFRDYTYYDLIETGKQRLLVVSTTGRATR